MNQALWVLCVFQESPKKTVGARLFFQTQGSHPDTPFRRARFCPAVTFERCYFDLFQMHVELHRLDDARVCARKFLGSGV
jgi:hypothetical protein